MTTLKTTDIYDAYAIQSYLTGIIKTKLTGRGKPVVDVLMSWGGKFEGKSPMICVVGSGDYPDDLSISDPRFSGRIYIMVKIFVKKNNDVTTEETLGKIHHAIKLIVAENRTVEGMWSWMKFEGRPRISTEDVDGTIYWVYDEFLEITRLNKEKLN